MNRRERGLLLLGAAALGGLLISRRSKHTPAAPTTQGTSETARVGWAGNIPQDPWASTGFNQMVTPYENL